MSAGLAGAENVDNLLKNAKIRADQSAKKIKEVRVRALEQMKVKKEDLRKKVSEIKDVKKREAAEKIIDQFSRINLIQTSHFSLVLNKLDAVLQKIKSRAEKAKNGGNDLTAVNQAIEKAEQSIAFARETVVAQAAKTYLVDASVFSGISATAIDGANSAVGRLRGKFKETRKQLFDDLSALRGGAIKSARESVKNATETLIKVPNVDKEQ